MTNIKMIQDDDLMLKLSEPTAYPLRMHVDVDGTVHVETRTGGVHKPGGHSLMYSLDELAANTLCVYCATGYIALQLSLTDVDFDDNAPADTLLVVSEHARWHFGGKAIRANGGQSSPILVGVVTHWEHHLIVDDNAGGKFPVAIVARVPAHVADWVTRLHAYTGALEAAAAETRTDADVCCRTDMSQWSATTFGAFNGDLASIVAMVRSVWEPDGNGQSCDPANVVDAALLLR